MLKRLSDWLGRVAMELAHKSLASANEGVASQAQVHEALADSFFKRRDDAVAEAAYWTTAAQDFESLGIKASTTAAKLQALIEKE